MTNEFERAPAGGAVDRREGVLAAALEVFLRYGYRKTSMEDIAVAAGISRPGLYLLFASKQNLFAAAMAGAVERDLSTAARVLEDAARPLSVRLPDAFDAWTGRYIGAVGGELSTVAETYHELLDRSVLEAPHRFRAMVVDAIVHDRPPRDRATSEAIAHTLIAIALGLKHLTSSREAFRTELTVAVELLLR